MGNIKKVLVFLEHKNDWFLANEVTRQSLSTYKVYTHYVIAERELEGCIYSRSEISNLKDAD
jgi:hypothetical protein